MWRGLVLTRVLFVPFVRSQTLHQPLKLQFIHSPQKFSHFPFSSSFRSLSSTATVEIVQDAEFLEVTQIQPPIQTIEDEKIPDDQKSFEQIVEKIQQIFDSSEIQKVKRSLFAILASKIEVFLSFSSK
jgi:hypothetical protein